MNLPKNRQWTHVSDSTTYKGLAPHFCNWDAKVRPDDLRALRCANLPHFLSRSLRRLSANTRSTHFRKAKEHASLSAEARLPCVRAHFVRPPHASHPTCTEPHSFEFGAVPAVTLREAQTEAQTHSRRQHADEEQLARTGALPRSRSDPRAFKRC